MKLNLKFIGTYDKPLSSVNKKDILIVGKSNSGKSSLINQIFHTKIARISKKPGKTQNLNFYDVVGTNFHLVDTYGYGYAALSKKAIAQHSLVVDNYFNTCKSIAAVIFVLTADNFFTNDDLDMFNFLQDQSKRLNYGLLIIVNKIDKTNQSERHHILDKLQNKLNLKPSDYILNSSKDRAYCKVLIDKINELTNGEFV